MYNNELETASKAVNLASRLTKQHLLQYHAEKTAVSEETKADATEVTVADFAAQAVIISIVAAAFPDDVFIAEESAEMLRNDAALAERVFALVSTCAQLPTTADESDTDNTSAEAILEHLPRDVATMIEAIDLGQKGGFGCGVGIRTWILDPIDGTKTYIKAQQYAVCLSLIAKDEQQLAVLGCPNLDISTRNYDNRVVIREDVVDLAPDGGWIVSAVKGGGVWLERISKPGDRLALDQVLGSLIVPRVKTYKIKMYFTDSAGSPHTSQDQHNAVFEHFLPNTDSHEDFVSALPEGTLSLNIWSQQLKYVVLTLRAAGADAMIRLPPQDDYHASVWDHAGGQLLLTESGGHLTDAQKKEFVIDGRTRKLIHNWGICAIRGGNWGMISAKSQHEVVHELVRYNRRVQGLPPLL